MSESGKPDRWNSLLETLGVPVSQAASGPPAESPAEGPPAKKPQPVSMLPPQKQKAAPKPKAGPPAAKSPSYWSRIAGALGLETSSPPEPAAVEEPKVEHRGEPVAESLDVTRREAAPEGEQPTHRHEPSRHEARPRQDSRRERERPPRAFERGGREERRPRHERGMREERSREERSQEEPMPAPGPPSSALDEMFGAKPRDLDVFSLAGGQSPQVSEPEETDDREQDRGSVLDYDLPREGGSDLALEKMAGHESGFESEGGSDEVGGRRRRRRRRGRGRRGGAGASRDAAPPSHEADIEPAGEEADFDFDRDEEFELELEGAEGRGLEGEPEPRSGWRDRDDEFERYPPAGEQQPRPRDEQRGGRGGRRQRGRDRGRERGEERPSRREHGGQRGGPPRSQPAHAVHGAEEAFDEDLSIEGEDGVEAGGDLPTHKKIPTWEEAVGMLIEANMSNRGPDRDRDRGHGRGRGGRGRG